MDEFVRWVLLLCGAFAVSIVRPYVVTFYDTEEEQAADGHKFSFLGTKGMGTERGRRGEMTGGRRMRMLCSRLLTSTLLHPW